MRYFVHCDNSFRKQPTISIKLNFLDAGIDEEEPRNLNSITFLYGYTYSKISSLFSNMNVRLQRRSPDDIDKCLTFTDCVILFHNFVEYDNGMQSIIDTCIENNIPLVIFSNHVKKGFLSNASGELLITNQFPHIKRLDNTITVKDFNFKFYKHDPRTTFKKAVELTRQTYNELNQERTERSIKLYNFSLKNS